MLTSCADYLDTIFPALIARGTGPRPPADLVVQVLITDRHGDDRFYRISEEAVVVGDGVSDDVDLTLAFEADALLELAVNSLDVPAALAARRLRVYGDESHLLWLAQRMAV